MFEFDPAKSAANAAKHGIDFEAAQALWRDDELLVLSARPGKYDEERQLAIGRIGKQVWTAIFTMRGANVRIISVRRARESEVSIYESN